LLRVLQGPHIHEALHQVAVSELVLDSVGVIWARFLEELLEVVLRQLLGVLQLVLEPRFLGSWQCLLC
jgi:hypothetical protein